MNYVNPEHGWAQANAGDRQMQPVVHVRGDLGMTAGEKLWSTQELADFLGLSIQTIYRERY